ncbi:MAG: zinc ribbon domain-containing protein [Tannerella sp.]|jgi:hypothetical protein|nr:zinc ribbon domain-containing protein [Tannerella sp.]
MRCKNCGWDNPDNSTKCVKCNQPLYQYQERGGNLTTPDINVTANFNVRKTVSESSVFPDSGGGSRSPGAKPTVKQPGQIICYNCKSVVPAGYYFCPECGAAVLDKEDEPEFELPEFELPKAELPKEGEPKEDNVGRRTVRPGKRCYCSLTLIPDEKEPVTPASLPFSGEEIILNRANTEPDNVTITSKEQAVLTCENKRWYIEDRSELKTTYLYVSGKTEIKPGDIIVLGDRRFVFDY